MDTANTINLGVERNKKDSSIKSESTVFKGNTDDSIEKSESREAFSNTLKDEMKNNKDSQENVSTRQSKTETKNEDGNNLPDDKEKADKSVVDNKSEAATDESNAENNDTSDKETDETINYTVLEELFASRSEDGQADTKLNALHTMLQQINYGDVQAQSRSGESVVETFNNPLVNSKFNLFEQINKSASGSDKGAEVINSWLLNTREANKDGVNVNSLFNGSLNNAESSSVSGSLLTGSDYSSGSQQNNSYNQQFTEMQMRMFNQDSKLSSDAAFNLDKLAQVSTEAPKAHVTLETNPLNQARPVSELMIKTPVLDKHWGAEFNNQIAYMSKAGGGNALIKLNPANLGPVEASIRVVNEVATIQIAATHATTREAMDLAVPKLKEMLSEQGFSQVNVDISDKGFSQQSDKSNQGTSSASNNKGVDGNEGDFSNTDSMTVVEKSESSGVVDYFA